MRAYFRASPCPAPAAPTMSGCISCKPFAEAMALDAAMPGATSRGYGSGDDDPSDVDDINAPDSTGFDLGDKIRQLLEGKLDDADISALIALIQPDDTDAPTSMPAQDKRRRMGR